MKGINQLEKVQRELAAMEWDIQNGQFNKRKIEYYKNLVRQRDELLKKATELFDDYNGDGKEVMPDEEDEELVEGSEWSGKVARVA